MNSIDWRSHCGTNTVYLTIQSRSWSSQLSATGPELHTALPPDNYKSSLITELKGSISV